MVRNPQAENYNSKKQNHLEKISAYRIQNIRPRDLQIIVRTPSFDYKESLETNLYWFNNDPFGTHFFNALQAIFPEGEPFFIQAALDGVKILKQHGGIDNQLEQDLKLFQKQEAHHSQQHRLWTNALIRMGYKDLSLYKREIHHVLSWFRRNVSTKWRLSITAAAEHYTASLVDILTHVNQDLLKNSAFPFNVLLLYHAMEEIEHKSVCFDLAKMLSPSYLRRIISLIFITFDLAINVFTRMKYMLKKDGLWGRKYRGNILSFFLGKKGLLKGIFPRILQYLSPSFHPWLTDEREGMEHIFKEFLIKNNIQPFNFDQVKKI